MSLRSIVVWVSMPRVAPRRKCLHWQGALCTGDQDRQRQLLICRAGFHMGAGRENVSCGDFADHWVPPIQRSRRARPVPRTPDRPRSTHSPIFLCTSPFSHWSAVVCGTPKRSTTIRADIAKGSPSAILPASANARMSNASLGLKGFSSTIGGSWSTTLSAYAAGPDEPSGIVDFSKASSNLKCASSSSAWQ